MGSYDTVRQDYLPKHIKVLLVGESPPPAASRQSSRHFYRTDKVRIDDRLFVNTIKALYPEAAEMTESQIEPNKEAWLRRFQKDGYYMIEALETSLPHHITKEERRRMIIEHLPRLLGRIKDLAADDTKIILIKSNVFDMVAEPLKVAGFKILNTELVDYPGRYNQRAYRDKLSSLLSI